LLWFHQLDVVGENGAPSGTKRLLHW
jgi:hypothetical protein